MPLPNSAGPPPRTDALERARARILRCHRCPRLVARRRETAGPDGAGTPVPGFGDPAARVFLLGLATAATGGNRTGRAFTGNRSATFLVAGLYRAGLANQAGSTHVGDGLELHAAWLASAVRCPPPANRPTAAETANCAEHLRTEWDALPRLRVVVALGALAWTAAQRAAGVHPGVPFAHAREQELRDGVGLLGCYHPSPQNTNTGRLTVPMLDATLHRARELAGLPALDHPAVVRAATGEG